MRSPARSFSVPGGTEKAGGRPGGLGDGDGDGDGEAPRAGSPGTPPPAKSQVLRGSITSNPAIHLHMSDRLSHCCSNS